ncbi:L-seryl-tRNA(Sec) selenium transferase [Candidatus Chloroploca sp. Khr17]|uniref:L-seryl-tRNA(Sec) selenium transferase n=1 Tax=Candidatus Chloroploca sp. Khr17 TaxID=2496869 RepID=UPI00351357D2
MLTRRDLPSVDRLLQVVRTEADPAWPGALLREAVRAELDDLRGRLQAGEKREAVPPEVLLRTLAEQVIARITTELRPSLRPVINATGVIIQTNLGRAPLSVAARAAMHAVAPGYSNLEYDLVVGKRGSRNAHLEALLTRLTGAEAALAVNNNAAAVYLALIALAAGREVIVSRGQAVEIGGGFRIPDVLRQSGATLVEVGTTNRTYARDYAAAITERTAMLLRVHSSNFRLVGFVHEASLAELATVAQTHGVPLVDDLGSGTLLPTAPFGLAPEPMVQESIAAGADLVTFSGDKLLGGPQAGLLVGRATLIAQLRRHPLARALRLDKTTIAGLEATLRSYLRGQALNEIPVWQMISAPLPRLQARAAALAAALQAAGIAASVMPCRSAIGGGSLPGETLASVGVAVLPGPVGAEVLMQRLRLGEPAVIARISDAQILFDLRTVGEDETNALVARVLDAS